MEEYKYSVVVTMGDLDSDTITQVCDSNSTKLLKGIISDKADPSLPKYYFIFESNPLNEIEFDYLVMNLVKPKQTPFEDFLNDFTRKITEYPLYVQP